MNVTVVSDHVFYRLPDGSVWTEMSMPYSFWARYLSEFERVRVIGRVYAARSPESHWMRADGEHVIVEGVKAYRGPLQYALRALPIHLRLQNLLSSTEAYILRLPSNLGFIAADILTRQGYPFGVEVVGDPYEVFAPGATSHPLRPVFRHLFTRKLRQCCRNAKAVSYVTESTLQKRYPPAAGAFSTHYSSIQLPGHYLVPAAKTDFRSTGQVLIAVGSLAQMYKGPDVLLKALSLLIRQGLDVRLVWVGGGRYLEEMRSLAVSLGLEQRVRFTGTISSEAVRDELDHADIFVLPSRTEGLPRALIEAMARGLPCVGTSVGGIPELLDECSLVPPDDVVALAARIRHFLVHPDLMKGLAQRNLRKAREFTEERLDSRRRMFYRRVRELTGK